MPWRALAEIALVFVVFFLHGAWPMPDVNETGYVIKAQHYWNHDAFRNDFFANSADAHPVYYFVFGWLTTLGWSLTTAAWIGRIITWLMLAVAWRGLSWALIARPWMSVLSAELFILLCERAAMAGEWIVGGVEAKGFAWAFALWALTALVCGRWNLAWLLAGAATSLHVVVGGWSAVCLAAVWLWSRHDRPSILHMLPGLIGFIIVAAPGLWPVLRMNHGADWQTIEQANRIEVFERLRHHLLPYSFSIGGVIRQLLLWIVFLFLCRWSTPTDRQRRLRKFVMAAMGLSVIGFLLSVLALVAPTAAANLLRFYWTRMTDILVPLGTVLIGLAYLSSPMVPQVRRMRRWWILLLIVAALDLGSQLNHLPWWPKDWGAADSRAEKFTQADDWVDVCRWVADPEHTPQDAVFLTPYRSMSFKWYSGRGEVVTWKDMPQDARSIAQWWQRMNDIHATGNDDPLLRWHDSLAELGDKRLNEVATKYGAQYAIVDLLPDASRLARQSLYENKSYAVYRVGQSSKASEK